MNNVLFEPEVFGACYNRLLAAPLSRISTYESQVIEKQILLHFFEKSFMFPLKLIWERVLMVELNAANADNLIPGSTEKEKFDYFVSHVTDEDNLSALYEKYPELRKVWEQEIQLFTQSISELLERLSGDIDALASHFYNPGVFIRAVTDITPVGDPHKGRRQAAKIHILLSDGSQSELFYKPRSLSVDQGFTAFLEWWNSHSSITHQTPKILMRAEYGWAEAIAHSPCQTQQQVKNFYERYGSLIAFAYAFSTTDLHNENIIACGEYPVIVDLETLFSCTFKKERYYPILYHLHDSLLMPSHAVKDDIELSPLAAQGGKQTNIDVLYNPQERTPSLKMQRGKLSVNHQQNTVNWNGQPADFMDYTKSIIDGFKYTYSFIIDRKETIISLLESSFNGSVVRVLTRPTLEYVKLLENKCHPNALHFGHTEHKINTLAEDYFDSGILQSEIEELRHGDVPYFEMSFSGHQFRNGKQQIIDDVIELAPFEKAAIQIDKMTMKSLDEQIRNIRYTFMAYKLRNTSTNDHASTSEAKTSHERPASDLANQIKDIAITSLDNFRSLAIEERGYLYWPTIDVTDDNSTTAIPSPMNLYNGTAGIMLCYFHAGVRYSRQDYLDFSHQLAKQIIDELSQSRETCLGAYSGTMNIVWALSVTHRANLITLYPTLEQELEKLSHRLVTTDYTQGGESLDIVSGLAGTIMVLLRLHAQWIEYPIAKTIGSMLDQTFYRLITHAPTLLNEDFLLGYAHGTSGISSALASYMSYFSKNKADAIAVINKFIDKENSLRSPDGWPDLRESYPVYQTSWCSGTNGIGFSRLRLKPFISEYQFMSDMRVVIKRIGEEATSLAPCHGMSADLVLLNHLILIRNLNLKIGSSDNLIKKIFRIIEFQGLRTDYNLCNHELVGYMTGISGILDILCLQGMSARDINKEIALF